MVRTRFAPSPTGYLHVGGARTALFNWLFARHQGGRFILRIEDTDEARNTEAARAAIYEGLRWLGLDWDEGPDVGGSHGPYQQSERRDLYDRWFARLQETGRVYADGEAFRFRFERRPVTVSDLIAGEVTIDYTNEANTPDMVIRRSDGSYVFHFVNVIDDIEMAISHVIRGDDHLPNTHKHVQLFEALGVEPPVYAHIPLILNHNGTKMSKRDEGASVRSYIDEGFLPEGVVNFLALLGWSPKDDSELMDVASLVHRFDLAGVNRKSAVFDMEKCRWFSGQYLQKLPVEKVEELARPLVAAQGLPVDDISLGRRLTGLVREKVRTLGELPAWFRFFHDDAMEVGADAVEKASHDPTFARTAATLRAALAGVGDWSAESIKAAIHEAAAAGGLKPGKLMFPLRLITTGRTGGPEILPLLEIIGPIRTLVRIDRNVPLLTGENPA